MLYAWGMLNPIVRSATKELRLILGMSQTKFGQLIGKSLNTVQRIETLVPASGEVLATLNREALKAGEAALAEIFLDALADELGVDSVSLIHRSS